MNESLVITTNNMLAKSEVVNGAYGIAIAAVKEHLSPERALACAENMEKLATLEQSETIAYLRRDGKLTEEDLELCRSLSMLQVDAAQLTLEEARKIQKYMEDEEEEILLEKTNKIIDILLNIRNGATTVRDYFFDAQKADKLMELLDKAVMFDKGTFDPGYGFDISKYPNAAYDMSLSELESYAKNLTIDELLDGGYINDSDVYIYGPFTQRDLDDMEYFVQGTYTTLSDARAMPRLESVVEDTVSITEIGIKADINRAYISELVLPARRLRVKELVAVACAFGINGGTVLRSKPKDIPEGISLAPLKKHLRLCSYYLRQICKLDKDELKKEFKYSRPVVKPYFDKILELSDSWDEYTVDTLEEDFFGVLIKLDDHLFRAQAEYADLMLAIEKGKAGGNSKRSDVKALLSAVADL